MTTATPAKAAHVLVVGHPDCDADLQHWLDTHAQVEHVGTFEGALEVLRGESFDLVISGAAEFLPTPSIPFTRPAAAILDQLSQGVWVVRPNGEVEWANAKMMTLPDELHAEVRELCLQMTRGDEVAEDAGPMRARRATVSVGSQRFTVTAMPIVDRHHRLTRISAVVEPLVGSQPADARESDVDHAGRELLSVDARHYSRLQPHERLALLEQKILRCMQDVLHFDTFEIRVLDAETNRLDLVMCQGMPADGPTSELFARSVDNGVCGYVAVSGRSHICDDVTKDRRYVPGLANAASSLTVPLWLNETVVGVANFESTHPAAFHDDDRRLAENFGRYVAMALHMLELLAFERQAAVAQLGRAALEDASGPINDILTDVESLVDAVEGDAIRDRLRVLADNAVKVRDAMRELSAAKPCLIGARTAAARRVDPLLEGRRVLLADDEEVLRETVRDVLIGYGCVVCTAADGASAIELIGKQPFDLVLSDIKMPVKTGYEVFAAAKQANPQTPVILTTGFGYDPNHTIIRARREGLAAVLFKPFKVDQLLGEIRSALKAVVK